MTAPQTVADVLDALADRCEAATLPLPNRTLNRDIARAMGWGYQTAKEAGRSNPAWFHPSNCRDGKPVLDSLHGTDVWREPVDYVGSLDAAMTIAPAAWDHIEVYQPRDKYPGWTVHFIPVNRAMFDTKTGYAASYPLALCAAALRAAATSARQGETK